MKLNNAVAGLAAVLMSFGLPALSAPTLEDYAALPNIRSAELSPDGSRYGAIIRVDDEDYICTEDLSNPGLTCYARLTEVKPNRVGYANDDTLIVHASETKGSFRLGDKYEFTGSFAVDLKSKEVEQLLKRERSLYPVQSGIGHIVGISKDRKSVFMPAYVGEAYDSPSFDLFLVDLKKNKAKRVERGNVYTENYYISWDGDPLVRVDYNARRDKLNVLSKASGKWKDLIETEGKGRPFTVVGVTRDKKALLFLTSIKDADGVESEAIFKMDLLSAEVSEPVLNTNGREIAELLKDDFGEIVGVRYDGMWPTYDFLDEELDADIDALIGQLPNASVFIDSWDRDFSKILLLLSGTGYAEDFGVFDRESFGLMIISTSRPGFTKDDFAEADVIKYQSTDDLTISAVMTWPLGVAKEERKSLPTVILPHGGPASYDSLQFDWMAQYLASEGYLVLQPNFRGSTGSGTAFRKAGAGQWGRAMQDDITNGVNALIQQGWADPDRVCIVGWSYGGYAALAGGAFTPDLYKCVVSINGVADPASFISFKRDRYGPNDESVLYWKDQIEGPDGDVDVSSISPARNAENFQAPVLLIHGKDDTNVPLQQSLYMEDQLDDLHKPVTLIKMKNQDHSLSTQNARVEAFAEVGAFLAEHLKGE